VSLLAAHAAGCTPIVLTDINQERLAFAKKLIPGVQTCLVGRKKTAEETARAIKMLCGEVELKHALECTGAESSIKTAILVGSSASIISSNLFNVGGPVEYGLRRESNGDWSWCV
jgi:threonine dehydrogenase-like Zn-dependent dehydrogenase